MSSLEAITTTSAALQQVARLLHSSPYAARVHLPKLTAERAVNKLLERYPTTTAHRNIRSALRVSGLPVVQAVLMPPDHQHATVILLANVPPDDRENWQPATDSAHPLTWRGYEVTTAARMQAEADKMRRPQPRRASDADRITWRFSAPVREQYRTDITRTIHAAKPKKIGTAGGPRAGTTRTPDGMRKRLEDLGRHLSHYPGLNGVNVDRWLLKTHMLRLWKQQHPDHPPPQWPHYPYLPLLPVTTAPLADLWPTQEDTP